MNKPPKVGDRIRTWFNRGTEGYGRVTAVRPYDGRYPQFFDCFVTVTAPRTNAGEIEMAYHSEHSVRE